MSASPSLRYSFGWALSPGILLSLLLLALSITYSLSMAGTLDQLDVANRRLSDLQELQSATTNYARRTYEVVLGRGLPQGELRAARLSMERGLVRLSQNAKSQAEAAIDTVRARHHVTDLGTASRLLELYHSIDASASRAFVLGRDGKYTEAERVLAREVEFRLTNELEAILADAIRTKSGQVADLNQQLHTSIVQAAYLLGGLAFALFPAFGFAWHVHNRSIRCASYAAPADFELRAQELRAANEQLRENDKRRAQFLADVSHELRTPLTILRGEADVALMPGSPAHEQKISLERIQRQASDMAQLLDDLLAFARSNIDDKELETAPTLIEDLVSLAVEDAENLAEPRELTLNHSTENTGLWANVDRRRFKQAIIVGLDNAINHSPPGGSIDVLTRRAGDRVEIIIADHGPGLTAEDEQRAFERFYRGDRSSNASGLGIGLAIAQSIVEAHDGTIALTNQPSGGGQLRITLPLLKGQHP